MSSSYSSLMFVYLFVAFKCLSGVIFNEVWCSVHTLNAHARTHTALSYERTLVLAFSSQLYVQSHSVRSALHSW